MDRERTLMGKSLLVDGWSKGLGGGIGSSLMYDAEVAVVVAIPVSDPDCPSDSGELGLMLGLMTVPGPVALSACINVAGSISVDMCSPLSPLLPLAVCFRIPFVGCRNYLDFGTESGRERDC